MFSLCEKACLFGTYVHPFLIFTDKMAKKQTVFMVFQKILSFMTEILFYLASKMIDPK